MHVAGPARRLTVFISEADTYAGRPLATEIVERARKAGIAGATVLRGVEGFGLTHGPSESNEPPVMVMIVDSPERIEAFIPELDAVVSQGLVVAEDLDVVKYVGRAR